MELKSTDVPSAPSLTFTLSMPQVEGIFTSFFPGYYAINTNEDIVFTLSPDEGYAIGGIVVKVNNVEIKPSHISATGELTYTITKPQSNAVVTIEGVKPNVETGTESIKAITPSAVYQAEGSILVSSSKDGTTYIYTPTGKLHAKIPICKGDTRINLSKGIYIVRINDEYTGKLIVK
ncbi:MAG: hypothetical protein LBQ73_00995 [Tannerellaceae bacterium]|nr:hypothetical protein [Tannerellaceae bacterium]